MSNTESVNRVNANELKKEVDMTVKTQRISESRFAAKGSFSKEFVKIVRTFSKFFWDLKSEMLDFTDRTRSSIYQLA